MNQLKSAIKGFVFVGQLGLSLVTPPLCMAFLASWLINKFNIGAWLMVICLLIGLFTAFATAKSFYTGSRKKIEKNAPEKPVVSFREHI